MSGAKPPIWAVLRAHFRADMRKTGALIILAVVMIVVYARMFFQSSGPSVADAKSPVEAILPVIAKAASTPLTNSLADRIPVGAWPADDIQNDPFAIDPDKYPLGQGVQLDDGHTVIAGRVDETIREEAKSLVLQSTVCCNPTLACINGQFLQPGQEIAGFVLERVEPNRVILLREGIQVALFLKPTGEQ